ncbi:MAG: hypothetical protein Q9184_001736 [Pyrenodesmia sp. 2 TL-2023]
MAEESPIINLLGAPEEPTAKHYQRICVRIIARPQIVSDLVYNEKISELLSCLTHNNQRLVRLFQTLFTSTYQSSNSFPSQAIVSAIVALFKKIIPSIQATDVSVVRDLASILGCYEDLVRRIVCDEIGAKAIKSWASSSNQVVRDTPSLEAWTETLLKMVKGCVTDHGLASRLSEWEGMTVAKGALRQLDRHYTTQSTVSSKPSNSPNLGRMDRLSPMERQSLIAEQFGSGKSSIDLPASLHDILKDLGIGIPSSTTQLKETIEHLEHSKTLSLLRAVIATFPCAWCKLDLERGINFPQTDTAGYGSSIVKQHPPFGMDIFGRGIGIWPMSLSTTALAALRSRQQMGTAGSLEGKLISLASGCGHMSSLAGSRAEKRYLRVPVFKTKCEPDLFILWQIDLHEDHDSRHLKQAIRVWDIAGRARMRKILEHVSKHIQPTYSAEKLHRCCQKLSPSNKVWSPIDFGESHSHTETTAQSQASLDVRSMDPVLLDLVNKFYPFTQPVLQSQIMDFMSTELPYQLSNHEMDIICYWKSSSLILGRSGTGKTTCLLFKLIGKYLASKGVKGQPPIRQILLTRSPELADKLRIYARNSIRALLPSALEDAAPSDSRAPMPVPQLDFSKATVLSLDDSYYPYVCTFEDFLRLLENTAAVADGELPLAHVPHKDGHGQKTARSLKHQEDMGRCVDFTAFKLDYWPQIPIHLTRRLPLSALFAEIMSVIKGSASSLESLESLTLEEYLQGSSRIAPVFTLESERTDVYEAFEFYEALKCKRGEVDYVDRAVSLLRGIRTNPTLQGILASAVEEVYIDEVQDHRCIDIALLLSLLRDRRGFHVAGDTAQAISQDATLRFADIKTLIHNHFEVSAGSAGQEQAVQAEMFQLGINYRSHHGIVALAAFIFHVLWKAFPDTVDKLVPEAGQLQGPIPTMFVGCGPEILCSSEAQSEGIPSTSTNFGADQVVLVRDDDAKKQLEKNYGNIGLTLTILQSKGMEFSDVKLVNFFSTCTDPSGLRRLPALLDGGVGAFDVVKHAAMCTELKQFYVAITRARSRLFIIESADDKELTPVVQMLPTHAPGTIVKIVRRNDTSFNEHLNLLHTKKTSKPEEWVQRGWDLLARDAYNEASFCFEQANNQQGITIANAREEFAKGRTLQATGDNAGAASAYETAACLFLGYGLASNAIDLFQLHKERGEYREAAGLFVQMGDYKQASLCYNTAHQPQDAAEALCKGKMYDKLVDYVTDNRGVLSEEAALKYGEWCKLPLRQKKISEDRRKKAISLLGSSQERERIFKQFDMPDALDELYLEEGRLLDLFQHRLLNGRLDEAIHVVLSKTAPDQLASVPDTDIWLLLDYTMAGRLVENARRPKQELVKLTNDLQKLKTPRFIKRVEQWKLALQVLAGGGQKSIPALREIADERIRLIASLQILDLVTNNTAVSLDSLTSILHRDAFQIVKEAIMGDDNDHISHMLAACGVWKTENLHKPYIVLPWSPLARGNTPLTNKELLTSIRAWGMERLTDATVNTHEVSRRLWIDAWPIRCSRYLIRARCRQGTQCPHRHEQLSHEACSIAMERLLWLNSIFCDLTALYNRQIMNEKFQASFLGLRRSWLECLIRELTWVSSFEQDDTVSTVTLQRLRGDEGLRSVAAAIDALLLFRLRKEWKQRREASSLLEQMQLATTLGTQRFFAQVLQYMTRSDPNQGAIIWRHYSLLRRLENDVVHPDVTRFRKDAEEFVKDLNRSEFEAFRSLHSITTLFEYLTTHIIMKTCVDGFVVPRSWISIHLTRICSANTHQQVPIVSDSIKYQQCLVDLMKGFCHLLEWLDRQFSSSPKFFVGSVPYQAALLQQRNAELLALAFLNLSLGGAYSSLLRDLGLAVDKVLNLQNVPKDHLKAGTRSPKDLLNQLVNSVAAYKGKNPLTVVKRGSRQIPVAIPYCQAGSMNSVMLPSILADMAHANTNEATQQQPPAATANEVVETIQRWWRHVIPRRRLRQLQYSRNPEYRRVDHFQKLTGAVLPSTIRMQLRAVLVSRGPYLLSELESLQQRGFTLYDSITSAIGTATEESFPTLEEALTRYECAQEVLHQAAKNMSDAKLKEFVDKADHKGLEAHIVDLAEAAEGALHEIAAVEWIVKDVTDAQDR